MVRSCMIMVVAADDLTNASVIGRLLEEVSWDGQRVRAYRDGGRGRENVLTAEVFSPLSYLPRDQFLGEVLRSAHGAHKACLGVASEIEDAHLVLLPDESLLPGSSVVVQPDATIDMPGHFVLIEAKRIRRASFQPEQLAREYITLLNEAAGRTPLLLLVLGSPPPVAVKGHGRLDPIEAVTVQLSTVLGRTKNYDDDQASLTTRLPDTLAWITWAEIRQIVIRQAGDFADMTNGLDGTIDHLASAVVAAIDWHS